MIYEHPNTYIHTQACVIINVAGKAWAERKSAVNKSFGEGWCLVCLHTICHTMAVKKIKKVKTNQLLEHRKSAREMFAASESSQPLCLEMRCEPCHQFEL